MRRLVLPFVLLALAAALSASAFGARGATGPVITLKTSSFGAILATQGHLALYTWNKEKGLKVKCTGCVREDVAAADDSARDDGAEAHRRGDGNVR